MTSRTAARDARNIPALSIRQPWAWLILHAGKDVENRTWASRYRGPLLVHAGKRPDTEAYLAAFDAKKHGTTPPDWLKPCVETLNQLTWPRDPAPTGAFVGVVDLVDVHHDTTCHSCNLARPCTDRVCSPWAECLLGSNWHRRLVNPRPLIEPIPYRGQLGLFHPPTEATNRINAQIGGIVTEASSPLTRWRESDLPADQGARLGNRSDCRSAFGRTWEQGTHRSRPRLDRIDNEGKQGH